jgi:hypothetical protein
MHLLDSDTAFGHNVAMQRLRISLRLSLLLFTLVAVCLGWIVQQVQGHRSDVEVQRVTLRNQIRAIEWLMERYGDDHRAHIADLRKRLKELE